MPSSGYTAISFTAGEQPTTAKWNLVGSNDASFNTGNGFNDAIILARHLAANVINQSAIDWTTTTPGGIWWQELGRATLGSAGTTLSVASFTARKYLRIQGVLLPSASATYSLRFNGDSATNYAYNVTTDGTLATGASTGIPIDTGGDAYPVHFQYDISNISTYEHTINGQSFDPTAAGVANTGHIRRGGGKWTNTAQITRIDIVATANMNIGSELIILGHD